MDVLQVCLFYDSNASKSCIAFFVASTSKNARINQFSQHTGPAPRRLRECRSIIDADATRLSVFF